MRILFLVQGEGRGHLTQAISLAQLLQTAGHEVIGAVVDIAPNRPLPAFFGEQFPAPITALPGPSLVYSTKSNALLPMDTLLKALRQSRTLQRSMRQMRDILDQQQPDVVVNFYQLLGALTYALYNPTVPVIGIAHQYLAFHPNFPFPKGRWLDRLGFMLLNRLNAYGATELLALSFDKQPDVPQERLRVVPPLLRREVTERTPAPGDGYLLAYTTQPGIMGELLEAHLQHPAIPIHAFHAGVTEPDRPVDATLTYHQIDGKRFLDFMQYSRAVVTTAGFESVCEAMYLGKPVLMMPQPQHFEQACNALDGQRAGAGVAAESFDLKALLQYIPHHNPQVSERFRAWHEQGYFLFIGALHRAVNRKTAASGRFRKPSGFGLPKTA